MQAIFAVVVNVHIIIHTFNHKERTSATPIRFGRFNHILSYVHDIIHKRTNTIASILVD
jgi:hypothetical protein